MKRKSGLIAGVVLAVLLCLGNGVEAQGQEKVGAAETGDMYNRGMEYYRNGDYPKALDLIRPAAERGLAGAQNVMGVMYANGEGVMQSYTEAVKWYRKAAARANYRSLTNLGVSFRSKKTGERAGSTGQSMNSGNYVVMKKNLREAQREMQKYRLQAAREGITIPQSVWETATVSY